MPEQFLLSKALDLTPTALGKSTFSVLKGLLVLGAIAGLGWAIYAGIIRPVTKPNPTTTQNAEKIENISYYPNKRVFFIGINLWGMDIGIGKYSYPDKPSVVK